jgi:polyhydroxybutyrate depolymerase
MISAVRRVSVGVRSVGSWRGRLAGAALALCVLAGCGGGDGTRQGDRATSTSTESATPPPAEATCVSASLGERRYILCTAGDAPEQGLVVALHGRGSTADEMRTGTELHRHAARQGLSVVYPEALDSRWGDDTFTAPTRPAGDEDVVFLAALIGELRADPRIGDGPVGLVGFSNGASMALRYASERPGDVRAVAAVAGQLPRDEAARPSGRVPLLLVYGDADPVRSYDTGIPATPGRQLDDPTPTLSTRDSVAAFLARSAGPANQEGPDETDRDPGDGTRLRTERWTDREGTLAVLHTVVEGGHTWPSARHPFADAGTFGPTSRDLDASAAAVDFVLDPNQPTDGHR